jgi:O-acetyl-ADP-ribose deacetylase (regulator of RNase III)
MRKHTVESFNANGHPFKVVIGDLVEMAKQGQFDVIVHGCNCHCTMGAGIAKIIKKEWPAAYQADLATKKGDRSKLGTYSMATVDGLTIVNLYTQYNYTRDKVDVEYEALETGLKKIKEEFSGQRIGLPMIGAGLAGGNWGLIKEIIGDCLHGEDATVVILEKSLQPAPDDGPEATEDEPQW